MCKIGFADSLTGIVLFRIDVGELSTLLFELMLNLNIFIIRIICDIHLRWFCCWNSSIDVHSVRWYRYFRLCNAIQRGWKNCALHQNPHTSFVQRHFSHWKCFHADDDSDISEKVWRHTMHPHKRPYLTSLLLKLIE